VELARAVVLAPVIALPIALFFWAQQGGGRGVLTQIYLMALVLAGTINLLFWVVLVFVEPRLARPAEPEGPAAAIRVATLYVALAMVGTLLGGLIIRATLMPTFLGSTRDVVLFGLYFLIFLALSLGATFSIRLFERMEDRVRADQELRLARRIQSAFLPTAFPAPLPWDVHALNVASRHVSGDFYDVVPDRDGSLLLAIADVSGKGVPAAMLSSMLQASLRTQATLEGRPVCGMLETINRLLLQQHAVGRFATMFLARLDAASGHLCYCNAGHNPPLLRRADGALETLETGGTVVGILPDAHWDEGTAALAAHDRLVLYTDGVTEAAAVSRDLFGDQRLQDIVRNLPSALASREVAALVLEAVDRFTGGAEPDDDRTLLVVSLNGPVPA
jgi:hypothetical protein